MSLVQERRGHLGNPGSGNGRWACQRRSASTRNPVLRRHQRLDGRQDSSKVASRTLSDRLVVRIVIGYSLPLWARDEYSEADGQKNDEDGIVPMGKEASDRQPDEILEQLAEEFERIVGRALRLSDEFRSAALDLMPFLRDRPWRSAETRDRRSIAHVNWKFRINAARIQRFLAVAAKSGYTFHFHQKQSIQLAFDLADESILARVLEEKGIPAEIRATLLHAFDPVSRQVTIEHLHRECDAPAKLRREQGERDIEREILEALFAAFLFEVLPAKEMHRFFDPAFEHGAFGAIEGSVVCADV